MEGFPYKPRPGQAELVETIRTAQTTGGHLAAESGTGTGKTVSALYASLRSCRGDGRRLVYATRTNSQQEQVVKEHRQLGDQTLLIPMMGRRHYCPLLKSDERFKHGNAEELGRLCRAAKQKAVQEHATGQPVDGACPFFKGLLEDGTGPVEAVLRSHDGPLDQLNQQIAEAGSCAYESFKLLLPQANVVVIPYVFVLETRLRDALMQWIGTTPEGCHLVVDEAHNLPDATRSHHSPSLGLATIERAMREAEELQDPVVGGTILTTSFLTTFHKVLRELVSEHAGDSEDGWMPPEALDEALMMAMKVPGTVIARIARELEQWGESIREQKRLAGKLPRSYLGAVAAFLHLWQDARDGPFVHLATREPRPALEAYLMDPAARLGWLREFASTTHMSGTLAPMDTYCQETGVDAHQVEIPSPFDPRQLQIYGTLGLRRSYEAIQEDPEVTARQQALARELIGAWTGRIGLWFPSHKMLADYVEEGFLHGLDASIYVEESGSDNGDLINLVQQFLADDGKRVLLLGVLGGRLTEGLDYPGEAMEHMLLFGVPYPKPSARSQALIHHYDARQGSGWRTIVHGPVGRIMRQTVGRLVRGPDDQGTAVILDERAMRFRDRMPHLQMVGSAAKVLSGSPVVAPDSFVAGTSWPEGTT